MSEPTDLTYWKAIVLGLFPYLARFGLTSGTGGALSIRAAAEGIVIDALETVAIGASAKAVQLAGGARGGVLTTSDTGGRLIWDPVGGGPGVPLLYYAPSPTAAFVVVATSSTPGTPPLPPATPSTPINLGPGSPKVSAG